MWDSLVLSSFRIWLPVAFMWRNIHTKVTNHKVDIFGICNTLTLIDRGMSCIVTRDDRSKNPPVVERIDLGAIARLSYRTRIFGILEMYIVRIATLRVYMYVLRQ